MEHLRTFTAKDAAGNVYAIEVWQDSAQPVGGATLAPRRELRTSAGLPVTSLRAGRYRLLTGEGDVELAADDADAD
jgi:hypothetical protein